MAWDERYAGRKNAGKEQRSRTRGAKTPAVSRQGTGASMATRKASVGGGRIEAPAQTRFQSWKLEDAKAKFSEVVRRAHDQGPQYVTVRGKPTVAIIDVAELQRLLPPEPTSVPLVQFLESLYVEGLDLERDRDIGRDVAL